MEIGILQYRHGKGWSTPAFPQLDSTQTLVLAFASPQVMQTDNTPFATLAAQYPHAKILGCSTAGEILGPYIFDDSIAVAVLRFAKTTLEVVKAPIAQAEDSYQVGTQIAQQLNKPGLRGIFVLSDGLQVNGSELVKGLNTLPDKSVVITGGLAGDGKDFKQTYSLFRQEILTNHVVAVGFYGEHIKIGHASQGGWDIFGPERRITRSVGNVLYELDGQPALTLYKEYLGEKANDLPASGLLYPLAIREGHGDDKSKKQLVRTILAIDEAAQSLTFAGDVPTGYLAQLMRANFDRLINSAGEAGKQAMSLVSNSPSMLNNPVLNIAISCVGRRLLLGERTEEETGMTLEMLPPQAQQIGFYSYGELSPYTTGSCDLHNQTMTLTTLYEED